MNLKSTLCTAGLALALAVPASASDLWLHMKVHDKGGEQVEVNLPLSAAPGFTGLLSGHVVHAGKVRVDGKDMDGRELRHFWQALKDSPDAEFVSVDGPDGKVRVAKREGYLLVRTDEGKAGKGKTDIKVPLAVVDAVLGGSGDQLDLAAGFEALARQGERELMTIEEEDGDSVRMWVDHSSEAKGR